MKKMLFIYNPKAGKAQIRNKLADILDVFTKGGYEDHRISTQEVRMPWKTEAQQRI